MKIRKENKVIFIYIAIALVIILAIKYSGLYDKIKKIEKEEKIEKVESPVKQWQSMNSDQKDSLLNSLMKDHDFKGVDHLSDTIKSELDSIYHSDIVWQIKPSLYSEFAQVLYADSGWITTSFKCSYRNYYNKKKYVWGGIRFKYNPEDGTLSIDKFSSNEMKDPDGPEE